MFNPTFQEPQDNFVCWKTRIKTILKAKMVWLVEPSDGVPSSCWSLKVQASDEASEKSSPSEYATDVSCSIILQGLAYEPFALFML